MLMKNKYFKFLIVGCLSMLFRISYTSAQYSIIPFPAPTSFTHLDLWHFNIFGVLDSNISEYYVSVRVFNGSNTLLVKSNSSYFQMMNSNLYVAPTNLGPLQPLTIAYTVDGFYANIVNTGGTFPGGVYNVFYTLYGRPTDGQFSELAEYEAQLSAEALFPPMLISVENGDTICETNPVFTWTPAVQPSGSSPLTYTFKMVEVQPFQSSYQAMMSNPYYYSQYDIPITMHNYPISAQPLVLNQQYAWMVDAVINNQVAASSEIWTYVYGCAVDTMIEAPAYSGHYIKLKSEKHGGFYEMSSKFLPVAYMEHYHTEPNAKLKYSIYEYTTLKPVKIASYPLEVKKGLNYYLINVCADGLNIEDGTYIFEVIDNVGIRWYLLFNKLDINCNQ